MSDIVEQLRIAVAIPICKPAADEIESLRQQLAASQAVNQQLLDFTRRLIGAAPRHAGQCSGLKCREQYCYSCNDEESADAYLQGVWELCRAAEQALALPQDTTAIEALITKAVEMMRGRTLACFFPFGINADDKIRALPGVTLEDLK